MKIMAVCGATPHGLCSPIPTPFQSLCPGMLDAISPHPSPDESTRSCQQAAAMTLAGAPNSPGGPSPPQNHCTSLKPLLLHFIPRKPLRTSGRSCSWSSRGCGSSCTTRSTSSWVSWRRWRRTLPRGRMRTSLTSPRRSHSSTSSSRSWRRKSSSPCLSSSR